LLRTEPEIAHLKSMEEALGTQVKRCKEDFEDWRDMEKPAI